MIEALTLTIMQLIKYKKKQYFISRSLLNYLNYDHVKYINKIELLYIINCYI